jgi:phage terminase large subunit|nr:MAG TPA: large terminase [Caudoviricetes sp.]
MSQIPHDWRPRAYQMKLWEYLINGGKRAVAVWHRRAGKDSLSINWTAFAATQRKGIYWHMLPTQAQARKVVWDGIDKAGRKIVDQAFPKELVARKSEQDMKIELRNGSIWQCVGSDYYDNLVGANPVGVVFSEYSIANPAAWDFIRPILAENNGWALFIYTPRGRNHGAKLFDDAAHADGWFAQRLSARETERISKMFGEVPPISAEAIEAERVGGMDEDIIEQEFYCSFDAAVKGTYYGKLINALENEGRICSVPFDPSKPVITAWDLGVDDSTAIWFFQNNGPECRVIDYYEASGVGLDHYVKVLKDRPYTYGNKNIFPHDIRVMELATGKTRLEALASLGVRGKVLPRASVEDGISAVRLLLPLCRFDETRCRDGLEALRLYRKAWDERRGVFQLRPLHDWTSHAADAFRYLALGRKEDRDEVLMQRRRIYQCESVGTAVFDPFHWIEE